MSVGFVDNLRLPVGEGNYVSVSGNVLSIADELPKSYKDAMGWSCAGGIIKNLDPNRVKDMPRSDIVHEFVSGASISKGAILGFPLLGIGMNKVTPIVDKNSPVYGAYSKEYVIGSSGVNVDVGYTEMISK